jgi:hypothetical protein
MNPDQNWIYANIEVQAAPATELIPIALPLPNDLVWVGVWELVRVSYVRVSGVAAGSLTLAIRDRTGAQTATLTIWHSATNNAPQLPTAYALSQYILCTAGTAPQLYIDCNINGDTFKVSTLWRRRLP